MATDLWPTEEGQIDPLAHSIGFFYANSTVTEGKPQKLATGTAGYIKCQDAIAIGDSPGLIALKTAAADTYAAVATYGVMKLTVDGLVNSAKVVITTGDFLINSAGYIRRTCVANLSYTNFKVFGGSSWVLGMALQPSAALNDEILVLIGKAM